MSMASFYCLLGNVARIVVLTVLVFEIVQADSYGIEGVESTVDFEGGRQLLRLVEPPPLWLSYRGGTIFSGREVPVYIIWYGTFSPSVRSHVVDFFASFQPGAQEIRPSVRSWWALTSDYKDSEGSPIASAVELKQEIFDDYSMGRYLTQDHIEGLIGRALGPTFPVSQTAFYLVLTAEDVYVEGFCTQRCASHFVTKENLFSAPPGSVGQKIPFAWVGNAASQCPGKCAWPFAKEEYGYDTDPLKPPSGNVGADGMIMNIASMLAGTATNPLNNGFYQGDEDLPFESATACAGVFGPNSYSGYPGQLQMDATGASFNANGISNRKYLLPALWSPVTSSCSHPLP
ncbi:unnamed protein product [Calypogeia fissa]